MEFLSDVGLSEGALWKLAEADCSVSRHPRWATTLKKLFAALSTRHSHLNGYHSLAEKWAVPVMRFASEQLLQAISEKQLHLLPKTAIVQLRNSLLARLTRSAKGVAEWESKLKNRDELLSADVALATARTLWRYPALARLWARQVDNWIAAILEFLYYTEKFLGSFVTKGSGEVRISKLVLGLSDPHAGNRTVHKLFLTDGTTWYFKPRSGGHEEGWFALLSWLHQEGFSHGFKCPRIVCEKDHFWMEAISNRPCRNRNEVNGFFFRAGALLYLAHLLRFVDLHAGNVIAHGDNPIFVDCETLLHASTRTPKFARKQERGVLRTGLLPVEMGDGQFSESISGYGRCSPGPHLARLRGRRVFAGEFVDKLISGFLEMHAFLGLGKYEAFAAMANRCLPTVCRQIRRPTDDYYLILARSLASRTMISGFDRSLFLQAACRDGIVSRSCIAREVVALEDADIPRLSGRRIRILEPLTPAMLSQSIKLIQEAFNQYSSGKSLT
jgi:lantibiotic modifying enzyme